MLELRAHGAQLHRGVATDCLAAVMRTLAILPQDRAGVRLHGLCGLDPLLVGNGPLAVIAANALGTRAKAVRALLFDKTATTNWALGWHQDRTICVRGRKMVDGFGPWTVKNGVQHVAPPFETIERMVTLRLHLDDVSPDNAPLKIAPGSHGVGLITVGDVRAVVDRCGTYVCLAAAGDIWAYSTPILHASDAAALPVRRRVLQVDYSADDLPGGLEWLGV